MRRSFLMFGFLLVVLLGGAGPAGAGFAPIDVFGSDSGWVGYEDGSTEPVLLYMWRAPGDPKWIRTFYWIDARGVALASLQFSRQLAAPEDTRGKAVAVSTTWLGLNTLPQPGPEAAAQRRAVRVIIDIRTRDAFRCCFLAPPGEGSAPKVSFTPGQGAKASCFDLSRVELDSDCVDRCVSENQMKAVSAEAIQSDCERGCSRKDLILKR